MTSTSLTQRVAILAFALAACGDATAPDSFLGLWTGSNSVFSRVQLDFQAGVHAGQVPDTIRGSVLLIFAQSSATVANPDFIAVTVGDSLTFSIQLPPSVGSPQVILFRGRRIGSRIYGTAHGAPIVLRRESS